MTDNFDNKDKNEIRDTEKKKDRYCSICHRPESVTGPLVTLTSDMCVCNDCMHKAVDYMNNGGLDYSSLLQGLSNIPGLSFLNFGGNQAPAPKKKKEEQPEIRFSMKDIQPPHKIKTMLDRYVVGQERAKRIISVGVYNHYKRIIAEQRAEERAKKEAGKIPDPNVPMPVEIQKSNMLMIGPTGSGKTYLVQTLARLLDVPLAITDATSLTEAGYIGDDIESVVSKLLANADNEGMLKLLEGAEIEVPVGASSKNAMVPLKRVNTKNILFICGGAFPDLETIIKERLNKRSSIGFQADLKDKYDKDPDILQKVTVEDLRKFGMIPEFLGRLPIIFSLQSLSEDMLVRILHEPQNAILRQYEALLELDEVKLEFEDEALRAIARKALERDTGARALRSIIEEFMMDIMYEIPKDDSIGRVIITKEYIEHTGGPKIMLRGQ